MSELNIPLLLQTMTYIEEHPEEWDQGIYHCGSAACFAGRAATLDGGEWVSPKSEYLRSRADDPVQHTCYDGGTRVWVFYRAQRILGLTFDQAFDLFAEDNTLDDLREIVAELTGGEVRDDR